ncbi:MAG TPA: glyoxalase superfamily protein [Lapillicoccus sp.]|nr:glyoxalase superfamily protein [Lapillicoccus sp.]
MTTPDPKGMARRLRTALADRDIAVSHSEALELVAQQLGARDWNTLAAAPPGPPAPEDHVVPVLRIFDEAAALDFYVGYLDFRVDWRNDTGGHEPLYAQLSRGDARIHLSGHHGDASPGSGVLVPVADAIELQLSLEAKEYAYANPGLEDRPWGRVVTVIDPFSNRIVFVERHEPVTPADGSEPRAVEAAAPIVLHVWVACRPDQAFDVFTQRFGEWWPAEAYSPGPLTDIRVEPRVGGPVTMLLEGGGAYPLGEVLTWEPGRHYAQSFTLAQDPSYPSRLDVTFEAAKHVGGTRVRFSHGGWTPANVAGRARFSEWDLLLGQYAALANTVA